MSRYSSRKGDALATANSSLVTYFPWLFEPSSMYATHLIKQMSVEIHRMRSFSLVTSDSLRHLK